MLLRSGSAGFGYLLILCECLRPVKQSRRTAQLAPLKQSGHRRRRALRHEGSTAAHSLSHSYHTIPYLPHPLHSSTDMSAPSSNPDDPKLLTDILSQVKVHSIQLKRCLDSDQIMEALKAASSMLAELRTSSLGPKQYYELYMSVFDSLRYLSNYLYEAHTEGKHHLADLYELVQ